MARKLQPLTLEQMALLVTWLDQEGHVTAAELARRLARPYFTVQKAVQRLRRRGGWFTAVTWGTCSECGQDLPMPAGHARDIHVHCERARRVRYSREARKRRPGQSTPYVRAYREHHPELLPLKREQARLRGQRLWDEAAPDEREEMLSKLHASDRRDYPATLELAENRGDPWSPDEDQYIIEHWHEPARDVAFALGRTLWAVRGRKVKIRRAKATAGQILPRSNRKDQRLVTWYNGGDGESQREAATPRR